MTNGSPDGVVRLGVASIEVEIVPAGASVRSIRIPGIAHSLVVGAEDVGVYGPRNRAFLGASVGRHANRIAHARFTLGGIPFPLDVNEPPHHLHGGQNGLWAKDWDLVEVSAASATFVLSSPDGDEGYPGRFDATAMFSLEDAGTLSIEYRVTVDRPGPVNMTSHLYFNLAGTGSTRDHRLRIDAGTYLPVDASLIPIGGPSSVDGGVFDFREERPMAEGPALLDHCFCVAWERQDAPVPRLSLSCEATRVRMELATTEPGIQVYDGTAFDGSIAGLGGEPIAAHGGIAIEPQTWPNGPNEPAFPSSILMAGEVYRHVSRYRFSRF